MAGPWLKFAANTHADAKLRKAKARTVWPWVLCRLKDGDGIIDDEDLDPAICSEDHDGLVSEGQCRQMFGALKAHGLLVESEGGWTTPNWRHYQADPTSKERKDRFNEKRRNVTERSGTVGNGDGRSERQKRREEKRVEDHPPTPRGGDEGVEPEGDEDATSAYYSARGGNAPAPSPTPPPEPVQPEASTWPAGRTQAEFDALCDLGVKAQVRHGRQPLMLDQLTAQVIRDAYLAHGLAVVREAITDCAGAAFLARALKARLEKTTASEPPMPRRIVPSPPRPRDLCREDDPVGWDIGTAILRAGLDGDMVRLEQLRQQSIEHDRLMAQRAAATGGGVG